MSGIELKMLKVRLQYQAKTFIYTDQKFISLKIVLHILFAIKGTGWKVRGVAYEAL